MKRTLTILCAAVLALGGAAQLRPTGRSLQHTAAFRTAPHGLPSKAAVYGSTPSMLTGHPEWAESAELAKPQALGPVKAATAGHSAQAILMYNDLEKTTNRVISLPLTPGAAPSAFETVADRVPPMPYKQYGERVVNAISLGERFVVSTFCSMIYAQTNVVYDPSGWEMLYQYDYRAADLEASALGYNPADGLVYGAFAGVNPATHQDEWFYGRWVDATNYTRPEEVRWLGPETIWYGMAIAPDGRAWVLDQNCALHTLDLATGATTLVGPTGLKNRYQTSACYDPDTERIIFATSLDAGSALYSIDPATARATMLYALPGGEQLAGLFVPGPAAADKAPAAATDLSVAFTPGEATGTISFAIPATCYDGSVASGTVEYEVSLNGVEAATGSGAVGTTISAQVAVDKADTYLVMVRLRNAAGYSPRARASLFCGTPIPRTPYFSAPATYDEAARAFSLSWSPARDTEGVTGGYVKPDELTFRLTRMPDGKTIDLPAGTYSYTDPYEPEDEQLRVVYYRLQAIYHGAESGAAQSSSTCFGRIIPPYADDFMNPVTGATYSTLSTATDKLQWSFIGAVSEQSKQHGWMYHGAAGSTTPMDSYLLMAPMSLEGGKIYNLTFTAACTNTSWRNEVLSVHLAQEATPEALKAGTILPDTKIYARREENGERISCNFTAPADGLYRLAFHHGSGPNMRFLYVGDIAISAPVSPDAPGAVTDLALTAGANGALQATLAWTMPTTSVGGQPLQPGTKVRIWRDGTLIADIAPSGTRPTYTDNSPANGVNHYEVAAYNAAGEGAPTGANVFIGVGRPSNPTAVRAWYGAADGQATVQWTHPVLDEFGTGIGAARLTYEIQRETATAGGETKRTPVATGITGTSWSETYCDPTDDQASVSYWVRAVTAGGVSQWVSTRKVGLGAPYPAPWEESFAGGKPGSLWHTINVDLESGVCTDEVYDDIRSVDADGGFFLAMAGKQGAEGLAYSGAIAVPADGAAPEFSFYYLDQGKYQGQTVRNAVEVVVLDADGQHSVRSLTCSGSWGWKRTSTDLSKYKGKKVQVGVYYTCATSPFMAFDAFRVADRLDHDADFVTLLGPSELAVGNTAHLTVGFRNLGRNTIPAGEATVALYCGDDLVATAAAPKVLTGAAAEVAIDLPLTGAMGSKALLHAEVQYPADRNPANNTSNTLTISVVQNTSFPAPRNASLSGTTLAWDAPDHTLQPRKAEVTDFESAAPWAREVPGWTILDLDGGTLIPLASDLVTPETSGCPAGFYVMDGSQAPFAQYNDFKAFSGTKYMAAQYVADADGRPTPCDDWLISPALSGTAQIASFMARSLLGSFPETFQVLYSTTGTEPSDFTAIATVGGVPASWIHFTVPLPEGARHFAIRCVSNNCLQLMVDDVELALESSPALPLDLQGYNVYSRGRRLNAEPLTALSLEVEPDAPYQITAQYAQGESPAIAVGDLSGIEEIAAPNGEAEGATYDLQGRPVHGPLAPGLYIRARAKVLLK